jgi:hypothetical protein
LSSELSSANIDKASTFNTVRNLREGEIERGGESGESKEVAIIEALFSDN